MADRTIVGGIRRSWSGISRAGVEHGLPPAWFGYHWVRKETVPAYLRRKTGRHGAGHLKVIHPESTADNPLPLNVASREELPDDPGWWGYSFRDVPSRVSRETFIATVPDCRVIPYIDPVKNDFWVGILNDDNRLFDLREIHFRAGHARVLRSAASPVRLRRATWVVERVYHNYSHWLTAHLPKFLLLESLNALDDVLLPRQRPDFVDRSLRMIGLDPERFSTFDPFRPLEVEELMLLGTDRFRPELLRMVRDALPGTLSKPPRRRVFISRAKAQRRRLENEEQIWPLLRRAGFERVFMEELEFEEQVALMRETAILFAPHGAGLTNMMFCDSGTHIVEIADPGFPNPNFYATASAMGHHYWLLSAESLGDGHPLERDLRVAPKAVETLLSRLTG